MQSLFRKFSSWDPALKYALGLYFILRVALSAWAAIVLSISPAPIGPHDLLRPYQGIEPVTEGWAGLLLGPWQRFDTLWYLKIAEQGYAADDGSLVYFPLYPLLIRGLGVVLGGNFLLAALIISNLALVGTLYLFYKLTRSAMGGEIAQRATLYLAFFLSAFFFLAGYTESLFLLLTLLAFHWAPAGKWGWAATAGFLASLTRLQGSLLILPLIYLAWRRPSKVRNILPLLAIPLGLVLFAAYGYFAFATNILGVYQGQLYAQFVWPWENIGGAIEILTTPQASFIDFLNLVMTFIFLGMTIAAILRLPREYGIYMLVTLILLLLRRTTLQPLVSMNRYVLSLFPAFMLWGAWGGNPWIHRLLLYPSLALMLYLAGQFLIWGWVG